MTVDILCVGHAVEDHILYIDEVPAPGAKRRANAREVVGGGPAASAAVTIARLGGRARLATRIGADAIGGSIRAELESEGVDCTYARAFDGRTSSVSTVLVDETGERTIINHSDSAIPKDGDFAGDAFDGDVNAVLTDTRWPEGASVALSRARDAGVPGVVDADNPDPDNAEYLELASHVAFSAPGLRRFTGVHDLSRALIAADDRLPGWACVTDGADGVYIKDGRDMLRIPALDVPSIDTLGAGDVWHGGFTFALASGGSPIDATRFANTVAALKIRRRGGRKAAPTKSEVDAFEREIPAGALDPIRMEEYTCS